jgi:hypothetical protein
MRLPNCQIPAAAIATMLTVIQNFFMSETGFEQNGAKFML